MWSHSQSRDMCRFELATLSGIFEMTAEVIFARIAEVNAVDTPD